MTTIFKHIVQICFRTLKRELENSAKNCRVLQFKLKKTEKSLNDTQSDLGEAESKLKSLSGGSNALDSINKVEQTVEPFSYLCCFSKRTHTYCISMIFLSPLGASIGKGFGGEEHANCQAGC